MSNAKTISARLDGRNILITGASRGLGEAIAAALWQAGANLALVARQQAELDRVAASFGAAASPGQSAVVIPADLALPGAPAAIAAALDGRFGELDGVVNNAGMVGPIGPLAGCDWEAWERTLRVNLLAPVALCRALIPRLRPGASIVNLSGGGATGPRPNFSAYASSKAALVRFTENLAVELAGAGVRVNAVAPGAMNTRMLEEVLEAGEAGAGGEFSKAVTQKTQGGTPPEKAAELVAWLVSPASAGVSGRLISAVWDPWSALTGERADELRKSDIYTLRRITPEDRGKQWE